MYYNSQHDRRLFLANLPQLSREELTDYAKPFGKLADIDIIQSRGYCFIEFETHEDAKNFMDNFDRRKPWDGVPNPYHNQIKVEWAYPRPHHRDSYHSGPPYANRSRSQSRDRGNRFNDQPRRSSFASDYTWNNNNSSNNNYNNNRNHDRTETHRSQSVESVREPGELSREERQAGQGQTQGHRSAGSSNNNNHANAPPVLKVETVPVKVVEKEQVKEADRKAGDVKEEKKGQGASITVSTPPEKSSDAGNNKNQGNKVENVQPKAQEQNECIVRVANMPDNMTAEHLRELLSQTSSVIDIEIDRRGTGYALFPSLDAAHKAIKSHDLQQWQGRMLSMWLHNTNEKFMLYALPDNDLAKTFGKRKRGNMEEESPSKKININTSSTLQGSLSSVTLLKDQAKVSSPLTEVSTDHHDSVRKARGRPPAPESSPFDRFARQGSRERSSFSQHSDGKSTTSEALRRLHREYSVD